MLNPLYSVHQNDREEIAKRLFLTLSEFDRLVTSANQAYEILRELGPFYGREDIKDPTFRVTAEPVMLPLGTKKQFREIGNDLLYVGRALPKLSEEYKLKLGNDLDFKYPPTWRIDAILDNSGNLKINEIECVDSASSLMVAQQMAYGLQILEESTAAKLVNVFKAMRVDLGKGKLKLSLIRNSVETNPHTANHKRLIGFIEDLSQGTIEINLHDEEELKTGKIKPNFKEYGGVLNETSLSPKELKELGVEDHQLISAGNYSAINNKGIFAFIFDESLHEFWIDNIGRERLERLKSVLIPSKFIETQKDLEEARKNGKVVKITWAGTNTVLINRSRGVALPDESIEHGSNERWAMLEDLLSQGVKMIAQDFVLPAKVEAFLRKKGTTLEPVNWYNRICVKYVSAGNPNAIDVPIVEVTAAEATLGPDIVPAGRACAFTAAVLR